MGRLRLRELWLVKGCSRVMGQWWEPVLLTRYQGTRAANKGRTERKGERRHAHLFHFLWSIQHGPDDHHSVQKVKRDTMRRGDILSAPVRPRMTISPWAIWDQSLDIENMTEELTMTQQLVHFLRVRSRVNRLPFRCHQKQLHYFSKYQYHRKFGKGGEKATKNPICQIFI